jgi:glycosyltransferase involved in cell wall biosynthesis
MSEGQVFYDLSEFVAGPRLTGIQRVSYQILRNWRFSPRLVPGCVMPGSGQAALLPESFPELMRRYFEGGAAERAAAAEAIVAGARDGAQPLRSEALGRFAAFLNAELFQDRTRLAFYRRLAAQAADRMHWLVHDALPWLRPELFPPGAAVQTIAYLPLLRAVPNLYFVSAACKRDFCERILLRDAPTYRVAPLGADSLGRRAPAFAPSSRRFTCIGTIEPRKNHALILDAFRKLWAGGAAIDLVFIGKLGWNAHEPGWKPHDMGEDLAGLSERNPRFTWHDELDDGQVTEIVRSSRATIYASEAEGFGLPPLESLALGVPAIASARLPSLGTVDDGGQLRLAEISAEAIGSAVTRMCDDAFAARKFAEIATLTLPTWEGLATFLQRAVAAA